MITRKLRCKIKLSRLSGQNVKLKKDRQPKLSKKSKSDKKRKKNWHVRLNLSEESVQKLS